MSKPKPPTYAETISELLTKIRQPISINELIDKFLEIRVPQTNDPRSSIRNKIREENGWLLIFSDDDHILPIDIAYRRIHFRIKITNILVLRHKTSRVTDIVRIARKLEEKPPQPGFISPVPTKNRQMFWFVKTA